MMATIILVTGLGVFLFCAVRARVKNNQYRHDDHGAIDSPMAEAIAQLVGIAGGIYLSLVMVVSFLGIDQPAKVEVLNLALDPLAVLAIVLAFVQPLVIHWLRKISR